jgi:hypothetical protein
MTGVTPEYVRVTNNTQDKYTAKYTHLQNMEDHMILIYVRQTSQA